MPELPEVETMVRACGRLSRDGSSSARRSTTRSCSRAAMPGSSRGGDEVQVVEVGRRGKWVVIALAEHRGIIVIQPRMTGGFWLVEPPRPDHIRLSFRLAKPEATVWYCDTRRLGKIHWFASPEEAERRSPGRTGRTPWRSRWTTWPPASANPARDQAGADGPEGAGGHRQHLRRRDPLRRADPPRADGLHAVSATSWTGCTGRSARSSTRRSPPRARASTPAIGPSWDWKGASWP